MLAEANGLASNEALVGGTQISVPDVKTSKNDASTFKPYDPSEAIGPTSPSLPYIPPPQAGCSAIAMIIRIVAVVVVVICQQYYAVGAAIAIGAGGEALAQTVEIKEGYRQGYNWGAIAVAGVSAGIGASGFQFVGTPVLNAAITAGVNYVASYAVNRILGVEDSFSWKGLATGVVTAAIGAKVFGGPAASQAAGRTAGAVQKVAESFSWAKVATAVVKEAGKSIVRSGIHYAVEKAITGESQWRWDQVLASAAIDGAAAGAQVYGQAKALVRQLTSNGVSKVDAEKLVFGRGQKSTAVDIGIKAVADVTDAPNETNEEESITRRLHPGMEFYDRASADKALRESLSVYGSGSAESTSDEPGASSSILNQFSEIPEEFRVQKNGKVVYAIERAAKEALDSEPLYDDTFKTDAHVDRRIAAYTTRRTRELFEQAPQYMDRRVIESMRERLDMYVQGEVEMHPQAAVELRSSLRTLQSFYSDGKPSLIGMATPAEQAWSANERMRTGNNLGMAFLGPLFGLPAAMTRHFGGSELQVQAGLQVGNMALEFASGVRMPGRSARLTVPSSSRATNGRVDYGNIPAEHHSRYQRYLDGPSAKKLGPDAWFQKAQRIWANNLGGNSFEQLARERLGAPLGKGSKPTSVDGYIPDLPVNSKYGVTDIKNVLDLSNSPQLNAFHTYAVENQLPFNLIIGPKTRTISAPLLNNVRSTGGVVKMFNPVTGKFSPVNIGTSGAWKR